MEYVSELLSAKNWTVYEIHNGKDDYLQINKPDSIKTYKIKVKALSKEDPVPFHTRSPDSIKADYLVICRNLASDNPEIFMAKMQEVSRVIHKHNEDYWLELEDYEKFEKGITGLV